MLDIVVDSRAKYLRVGQLNSHYIKVPKTIVLYEDETTTVAKLVRRYMLSNHIELDPELELEVVFKTKPENHIALSSHFTIAGIREAMDNYICRIFDVYPEIVPKSTVQMHCLNLSSFYFFGDPNNRSHLFLENSFELCFEFPQHHKIFYEQIPYSFTILQAVNYLIKLRELEGFGLLGAVKTLGKQLQFGKVVKMVLKPKSVLEVLYLNASAPMRKSIKRLCLYRDFEDSIVYYEEIRYMKVESVLRRESLDHFDRFENWGVIILGIMLKPNDFFSFLQREIMSTTDDPIIAIAVPDSFVFDLELTKRFKFKTDLKPITLLRKEQYDIIRTHTEQRAIQLRDTAYGSAEFLEPIIMYTSNYGYKLVNQYLRDTSEEEKLLNNHSALEFSICLIRSLTWLPYYSGLVFRGQNFIGNYKQGDIIVHKSFISTSKSQAVARSFGTLFKITQTTGKDLENTSLMKTEIEVLLLPYTPFEVVKINMEGNQQIFHLLEVPRPRPDSTNILFWVDDELTQGNSMRNKLIKENPTQVPEFVQLVSNQHLQRWLSNFSYCIRNPALKFALITDMNRGMNSEAGIRTITIIRQHLKDIPILMYVLDVAKTKHVLYANKIPLVDNLRITNKKAEVEQFIKEKAYRQIDHKTCTLV